MDIRKRHLHEMRMRGQKDQPGKIMDEFPEPDDWTIITAMNRVLEYAEDCQLSDDYFESCKKSLAYLRQELGLTNIQIVVLAMMVESGEPMSWKSMGNYQVFVR